MNFDCAEELSHQLRDRIMVLDGAMGTTVRAYGLDEEAARGERFKDNDKLKMFCDPSPLMCDAQTLFSGTFDRIQNQVFDMSCALGGCHDSEAFAGALLLESGTAHGALVDVDPVNGAAFLAGFKRVATTSPTTGDPDTSFLMLKIEGDLGAGMGERMPLGSGKISKGFRDMIELWILAGAPENGWVPGTDQ